MTAASNEGMGDSMPGAAGTKGPHEGRPTDASVVDSARVTADNAAVELLGPEPPDSQPRQRAAWQLRLQALSCRQMGSQLYAGLLTNAAADCEAGGPTWQILSSEIAPGRAGALALRFMAAVHRLVLSHRAPELAVFYPSAGGTAPADHAWGAFRRTLQTSTAEIAQLIGAPCQTNEVGRSAGLAVGFLHVMSFTRLPLRLREVGASAGLNLRCDHFLIGGGGASIGDSDSPVDLSSHWRRPPPLGGVTRIDVADRRGCDLHPLDPATSEGRLTLMASVWADQGARLERLRGALAIARDVPAAVDQMPLDQWTALQVQDLPTGQATVVYHSVVSEYLDAPARQRFETTLRTAGDSATAAHPLAWVRLEPISQLRHHGIQVTLWPGGQTRPVARCGAHGTEVEWLQ